MVLRGLRGRVVGALVLAVFCVSWASVLVLLSGAPAGVCALWRLVFSSLALLGYLAVRGEGPCLCWAGVLGGLALGAHFVLWMESLFLVPVSVSTTVVVSYPLFLGLWEFLRGGRAGWLRAAGLAVGFSGVVALYGWGSWEPAGVLLALGGSAAAAVYFWAGRRARAGLGASTLGYAGLAYGFGAVVAAAYVFARGLDPVGYGAWTWAMLLALAFVPMLGGHTALNYALGYAKASAVTSVVLGEPVGASLLAWALLGQPLGPRWLLAAVLVLGGVALILYEEASGG